MLDQVHKAGLYARLTLYSLESSRAQLRRSLSVKLASSSDPETARTRNIVVVGAAFAGYHAARLIAESLPKGSPFQVVVIEPNSHYNFTWVLPRFCVIADHEHKAFIPYTGYLAGAAPGSVQWIRDRVVSVGKTSIKLRDSADEILYEYLVVATGATVPEGLPSRVGVEDKAGGVVLLKEVQDRIRNAQKIVVAGGGAAGVELATDAKHVYPDKSVVLVHSRAAVMNRFGPGLQKAALEGLQQLGVEVVTEERVASHDAESVTLSSGRRLECDCYINCTGQRPSSELLSGLSPDAIAPSGHIKVKPTLQVADDALPNVYACGDVADTKTPNPNSRSARRQAEIVADNIALAIRGRKPKYTYTPQWGDGVIKLTLGLDHSVLHFWDGKGGELLFPGEEKDPALMCDGAWKAMGVEPFEDSGEIEWITKKTGTTASHV
ncbi:FAD/NAD(P)-binding domain-containing protein [Thozetella sp. PMI_491]|nr:FAD/NAD(P)-binding domain-containing protein [Thozetella sp. PMI_491]